MSPTLPAPKKPASPKKTAPRPGLPALNVPPLPPAYDAASALAKLGFSSRQALHESGIGRHLRRLPTAPALYEAAAVDEWALRLARLRILQAAGERPVTGPAARAEAAPADAGRDTHCPVCQGFALRLDNEIRCLHNHRTRLNAPPR